MLLGLCGDLNPTQVILERRAVFSASLCRFFFFFSIAFKIIKSVCICVRVSGHVLDQLFPPREDVRRIVGLKPAFGLDYFKSLNAEC